MTVARKSPRATTGTGTHLRDEQICDGGSLRAGHERSRAVDEPDALELV